MTDLRIAFYGDDVTGSVDVLLQFARCGLAGRLFVGTPDAAALAHAAADVPVVGIAGIARSLGTDALDAEVRSAFEALATIDPDIVQYKACSTADSSPTIGSLGRVLEIGRDVLGEGPVPILFAQPDFGRYTVFGHHFAAEAGLVHRLDRQPTMSTHPSTPMDESDLARHLARQTDLSIASLPWTSYGGSITGAVRDSAVAGLVLDALDDAHLATIGDALVELAESRRPLFAIGSGGLSRAVALAVSAGASRRFAPHSTTDASDSVAERETHGPVLVVSGSRSPKTRRQVDAAAVAGWHVQPFGALDDVVAALASGRSVALTSDDADGFASADDPLAAIAEAAASIVLASVRSGATRRVIVCGGDTSGRIVRLLGIDSLSIAATLGGNVVLLRAHAEDAAIDGLELLLKGGQVGDDDLFERVREFDVLTGSPASTIVR
ncbi:four-carbon acid sugar kinase family protein [Microbacterium aoyamense]|uniref:Four-carbon acid sugar kinase family protein n=1 Tax=Microbacterium aoyamense TaxID=344166 RepID=A0ABP5B135_9MICO|nr:four-carbon acid sugar kinase family protein [Microbacterium aoyamense]